MEIPLKKLGIKLPYDPAIPLLGIHPAKTIIQKDTCTPMFRLPQWLSGKETACQCRRCRRHGFNPWVGKIHWKRAWQLTPVFLLGKSHGQKSLTRYNAQGHQESDMTEVTAQAHPIVHCSTVYKSQDMKATQISIDRCGTYIQWDVTRHKKEQI